MVLLVLEAHGALHFGGGVDERAQRVAGQRVIVAAGVDVLELAVGFVIVPLRVGPLEEEALNFVGGVQGVSLLSCRVRRRSSSARRECRQSTARRPCR